MSIALHTGKIAAGLAIEFLNQKISADQLERDYAKAWKENFGNRLQTGRRLQQFFGSTRRSEIFIRTFKTFPFLARPLIKMTHGKSY
jgi:flavin-dependent dehydrogenase